MAKKKSTPVKKDAIVSETSNYTLQANVSSTAQAAPTKDTIRREMGLLYMWAFVIIIGGVLLFTLFFCFSVTEIKDLLLAISGVLSGPLGFIIGFYFKEDSQKNN